MIFAQLAFGGLFGLSIPGFHEIERGFFKSTGCVYLGCGWVFFVGKAYLVVSAQAEAAGRPAWLGNRAVAGVLLRLQRVCRQPVGEAVVLRARAYLFALVAGLAALVVSASAYSSAPFGVD